MQIHTNTGNTMYTYYTGHTYIYVDLRTYTFNTAIYEVCSQYERIQGIQVIHTIRAIRVYTHIYRVYEVYVLYKIYIPILTIQEYTNIYVLEPRTTSTYVYVHLRTYT